MYEMNARVRFSEVDQKANLTIAALINYMQDCCTFQSEDCGFPLSYMLENKRGWFLMTWQIRIHKLPKMGDEIVVKTAPVMYKGIIATRGFLLENAAGETLASASSNWVLMDLIHQRPLRIPEDMKKAYEPFMTLPGEWMGRKLPTPSELSEVYRFTVNPLYLDTNGHMNNEYYVSAALKTMEDGFIPGEIRVEYRNQAKLGDEVIVEKNNDAVQLRSPEGVVFAIVEMDPAK